MRRRREKGRKRLVRADRYGGGVATPHCHLHPTQRRRGRGGHGGHGGRQNHYRERNCKMEEWFQGTASRFRPRIPNEIGRRSTPALSLCNYAGLTPPDISALQAPLLPTGLRRAIDPQCDDSRIGPALTRKSASVIVISTITDASYPTDDPDACPQSIDHPPFRHCSCDPLHYKSPYTAP